MSREYLKLGDLSLLRSLGYTKKIYFEFQDETLGYYSFDGYRFILDTHSIEQADILHTVDLDIPLGDTIKLFKELREYNSKYKADKTYNCTTSVKQDGGGNFDGMLDCMLFFTYQGYLDFDTSIVLEGIRYLDANKMITTSGTMYSCSTLLANFAKQIENTYFHTYASNYTAMQDSKIFDKPNKVISQEDEDGVRVYVMSRGVGAYNTVVDVVYDKGVFYFLHEGGTRTKAFFEDKLWLIKYYEGVLNLDNTVEKHIEYLKMSIIMGQMVSDKVMRECNTVVACVDNTFLTLKEINNSISGMHMGTKFGDIFIFNRGIANRRHECKGSYLEYDYENNTLITNDNIVSYHSFYSSNPLDNMVEYTAEDIHSIQVYENKVDINILSYCYINSGMGAIAKVPLGRLNILSKPIGDFMMFLLPSRVMYVHRNVLIHQEYSMRFKDYLNWGSKYDEINITNFYTSLIHPDNKILTSFDVLGNKITDRGPLI